MQEWRCFDGSTHPVSEKFLEIVPLDLNGRPYAAVEAERLFLMQSGTYIRADGIPRFFPQVISAEQRLRLRAIDHVININRALQWLDGRDYRSHNEMFGPEGTLCQVHGNAWRPDTCGCQLSFNFDHWLRDTPDRITQYPHHFQIKHCIRHVHLTDFRDHYWAVLDENKLKNLKGPEARRKGRFAHKAGH